MKSSDKQTLKEFLDYAVTVLDAALPIANTVAYNPAVVKATKLREKYSVPLWDAVDAWLRRCPFMADLQPSFTLVTRHGTPSQKKLAKALRRELTAQRFAKLRVLLIADSELRPDIHLGGTLYLVTSYKVNQETNNLLTFHGVKMNHVEKAPERYEYRFSQAGNDNKGWEFVDVTDRFWRLYLQFGNCIKSGMAEHAHIWEQVTPTSKRCACCGMWSYRVGVRTVVQRRAYLHAREIKQIPVWQHYTPRLLRRPWRNEIRAHALVEQVTGNR